MIKMVERVGKIVDVGADPVRCVLLTRRLQEDTELKFLGFGTMNGKDGKPFKTREGGVMRLESLIQEINDEMFNPCSPGWTDRRISARQALPPAQSRLPPRPSSRGSP